MNSIQNTDIELLKAVFDAAPSGILAIDTHNCIILANKAAESILDNKELIGKQITEISKHSILPEIVKSKTTLVGQMIAVGNAMLMASYSPIAIGGKCVGAVSVFHDASILENTSCELHYVKDHINELSAIINSAYDGIFITDGNGVVLRLNEAYQRITGIKADEVLGRRMDQLVADKYFDKSVTLLVMETSKPATITQTVKGNKKLLVSGSPVFDESGHLFRVVTNVRDVTELAKLQDQLESTKAQTKKYEAELSHLRSMQVKDSDIIFRSKSMGTALITATKVAYVDSTVLIMGDSGTGKELIAKLIHKKGKGPHQPFIAINCAALPEHLLEAELFGYEGGAFTGAKKEGKPGLFELANNGTLFLDEIGDMPRVLQAKLLRALQEKTIMRVGGTQPISVNVRIIGATHRDIQKMAEHGEFRRDLFYRLMVVPIRLPPLKDRKEDIPQLVLHFVDKFNRRFGYNKTIDPRGVEALVNHSWPGNVRELENLVERLMVTTTGNVISAEHMPDSLSKSVFMPRQGSKLAEAVAQVEAHMLAESFRKHASWNKVAEALGMDRATAYRKASKYGLVKP